MGTFSEKGVFIQYITVFPCRRGRFRTERGIAKTPSVHRKQPFPGGLLEKEKFFLQSLKPYGIIGLLG